jgi:hypothetical protein
MPTASTNPGSTIRKKNADANVLERSFMSIVGAIDLAALEDAAEALPGGSVRLGRASAAWEELMESRASVEASEVEASDSDVLEGRGFAFSFLPQFRVCRAADYTLSAKPRTRSRIFSERESAACAKPGTRVTPAV